MRTLLDEIVEETEMLLAGAWAEPELAVEDDDRRPGFSPGGLALASREGEVGGDRLTTNFRLGEFSSRGTAVPARYLANVQRLARNLQVLRDHLGQPITITSGYRSPAHNRSVGGARQSQHLTARAADFRARGVTPAQAYCAIEQLIASGRIEQGGLGIYRSHVHYDVRGSRARWKGSGVSIPKCSEIGVPAGPSRPDAPPSGGQGGMVSCPIRSPGFATDRCTSPGTLRCPAIPDLLCATSVGGVPFEYPNSVGRGSSSLHEVQSRRTVTQRFIPSVATALGDFIKRMAAHGMQVQALLTAGSLYCRCISGTNTLSNHSYGDAIDIVGVRWRPLSGRARETIVHNYRDPGERAVLRRMNALLRLSFATVIDYHRSDHRDHFHCDMNRGRGRSTRGKTTVYFVQEALNVLRKAGLAEDGKIGTATYGALARYSGQSVAALRNTTTLNRVIDSLFAEIARS